MTTIVYNIGLLATPVGSAAQGGEQQGDILQLRDAHVVIQKGLVTAAAAGPVPFDAYPGARRVDAGGKLVTPGLVDAHTHLVFGGWRAHELPLKLQGTPYLDILKQGGGILSTVRATRAATLEELVDKAGHALEEMLALGTTACEAKSGYGLNLEDEVKQMEAVARLQQRQPVTLVSTLMAAHAVPEEYQDDREGFIRLVTDTIIPKTAEQGLAKYCDVFCETGVFSPDESRIVLLAAREHGLGLKIHADEINPIGGSLLAGELSAVSAEHLIRVDQQGIDALARGGVIACLLPATSFYLSEPYAPAQALKKAGVPIAVATDFNPGSCPGLNLQLCINLACLKYRMQPEEVLTAVTLNAAAAMGLGGTLGTLQPGKQGDLVVWNAPDLAYLCYRFGSNLARTVIKAGRVVAKDGRAVAETSG